MLDEAQAEIKVAGRYIYNLIIFFNLLILIGG